MAESGLPIEILNAKDNDDLFWAVLGGSPGNFGILTHVIFSPLRDKDYPDSRMMKFVTDYSKKKHLALEKLLAEMTQDEELPRNYDFLLTILGGKNVQFMGPETFELLQKSGVKLNEDECMMFQHPEEYGDGIEWAEEGKGYLYSFLDGSSRKGKESRHSIKWWNSVFLKAFKTMRSSQVKKNVQQSYKNSAIIIVYFKWGNVNGANEKFGEEEKKKFEALREAAGGDGQITDFPLLMGLGTEEEQAHYAKFMLKSTGMANLDYKKIKYKRPIPCSQQMRLFAYNDVREFNQPYYKRTYLSEKKDFLDTGHVGWVTDRVAELNEFGARNNWTTNIQLQSGPTGGRHSMYRKPTQGCHSWRDETTQFLCLDAFYDVHDENAKAFAKEWVEKNDDQIGKFYTDYDRRFLWSTQPNKNDPDQGSMLDTVWLKYFDSKEKYDKLVDIKRRFDPNYVFTANGMGIDASNAPSDQQTLIIET